MYSQQLKVKKVSQNIQYQNDNYIQINNRKYLGSKTRLLPFLKEIIIKNVKKIRTFIDGFAGTGVVACYFAPYCERVVANDLLYSNYIILHTYLNIKKSVY